jgi:plasmid stabilization system protein ParE
MASSSRIIVWSRKADRDVDDIWDYLQEHASAHVADDTIHNIFRVCAILERSPFAGRPRDSLIPGMRSLLSNPYTIFYRIVEPHIASCTNDAI